MIRLGLEYVFLILRRGARLAGGGKVRLGDDPSRTRVISYSKGEALTGLEATRSVSAMIRLGPG